MLFSRLIGRFFVLKKIFLYKYTFFIVFSVYLFILPCFCVYLFIFVYIVQKKKKILCILYIAIGCILCYNEYNEASGEIRHDTAKAVERVKQAELNFT